MKHGVVELRVFQNTKLWGPAPFQQWSGDSWQPTLLPGQHQQTQSHLMMMMGAERWLVVNKHTQ